MQAASARIRIDDGAIQRLADGLTAGKGVHHAIVAIAQGKDGAPRVYASGRARPDGPLMMPATPFFIASVTKLFIAATVFQLVERDHVQLSAPIATYLPDALVTGLHRLDGVDRGDLITVEHLLRHASGLPDWLEDRPRGGKALIDELFEGDDRTLSIEDVAATVRGGLTPRFPPQDLGSERVKVRYSDTNYQLLMAIVEAVTGRSLHEVYVERLFGPLGLVHTWLPGREPLVPSETPAAVFVGERAIEAPLALASLRDLYSTGADLVAFLRALTSGAAFDDPATARAMQDGWRRFGFPLDAAALRQPNWPIEYAMGTMRFQLPWFLDPRRRTPPVVGHTGSTGTWAFHCPELDLYLAGTVDQARAGPLPFRFVPRLLRELTA
ncbi:MAG: serine hydrolase domain-containing protein [Trueperaceae bacterium]